MYLALEGRWPDLARGRRLNDWRTGASYIGNVQQLLPYCDLHAHGSRSIAD